VGQGVPDSHPRAKMSLSLLQKMWADVRRNRENMDFLL